MAISVAELIKRLESFDQDAVVCVSKTHTEEELDFSIEVVFQDEADYIGDAGETMNGKIVVIY
jgi:hypothetical protein